MRDEHFQILIDLYWFRLVFDTKCSRQHYPITLSDAISLERSLDISPRVFSWQPFFLLTMILKYLTFKLISI